jgi:REP element-mobilizing transposase RayT
MTLLNRTSPRLKDFDYSAGWFFITICASDRQELFGKIIGDKVVLSRVGEILDEEWRKTGALRKDIDLDAFVIMPNHFHAVLSLSVIRSAPTTQRGLGSIIKLFKSVTTKRIDKEPGLSIREVWQRNYYDHIVRDEADLYRIREYIQNNPLKWQLDRENPSRIEDNPEEDHWFV